MGKKKKTKVDDFTRAWSFHPAREGEENHRYTMHAIHGPTKSVASVSWLVSLDLAEVTPRRFTICMPNPLADLLREETHQQFFGSCLTREEVDVGSAFCPGTYGECVCALEDDRAAVTILDAVRGHHAPFTRTDEEAYEVDPPKVKIDCGVDEDGMYGALKSQLHAWVMVQMRALQDVSE